MKIDEHGVYGDWGDCYCYVVDVFGIGEDGKLNGPAVPDDLPANGEYIELQSMKWRSIQIGNTSDVWLDKQAEFGSLHTLEEWISIGIETCCGWHLDMTFLGYEVSMEYHPYAMPYTTERVCYEIEPGVEECWDEEIPTGELGHYWKINGGGEIWCIMGDEGDLYDQPEYKSTGQDCIASANGSWSMNVQGGNYIASSSDGLTQNNVDPKSGTYGYTNYYGDYYDYHHWRNARKATMQLNSNDNTPAQVTGAIVTYVIQHRKYNNETETWGDWIFNNGQSAMHFGDEIELPVLDYMPAYYDGTDDEYNYEVHPRDGWEKRMGECQVVYTIDRYITE